MRFLIPVLCASLTVLGGPAALHAAPPPLTASQAVLAKGTPVPLRLQTNLRSGRDKVGEPVLFTVDQNLYGPSHTLVLTKGTPAHGAVTLSTKAGSFGHSGTLTFTCDYALAGDGTRVPLNLVVTLGNENPAQFTPQTHMFDPDAASSTNPEDYQQSSAPGGYYSQIRGSSASIVYDPGRFFGGTDKSADKGQKYTAKVAADTLLFGIKN